MCDDIMTTLCKDCGKITKQAIIFQVTIEADETPSRNIGDIAREISRESHNLSRIKGVKKVSVKRTR